MARLHWLWRAAIAFPVGAILGGFCICVLLRLPGWFFRPTIFLYKLPGGDPRYVEVDHRLVVASTIMTILPVLLVTFLVYGGLSCFKADPKVNTCCQKCGLNLTGNICGVCPECGTPTQADNAQEKL